MFSENCLLEGDITFKKRSCFSNDAGRFFNEIHKCEGMA